MKRLLAICIVAGISAGALLRTGGKAAAADAAVPSAQQVETPRNATGSGISPVLAKEAVPAAPQKPDETEAAPEMADDEDEPAIDLKPQADGHSTKQGGRGLLRDPTQPGPRMRQVLVPKGQTAEMPRVQLKARIVSNGQPPVIYMGIDKEIYAARQGDEFSPVGKYSSLTFRVTSVTQNQVRIDVSPLNRTLVLY